MESSGRLALHDTPHILRGRFSLLDGDSGKHGERLAMIIEKKGRVAEDKDIRMSGQLQCRLNPDSSCSPFLGSK
jgi:hypothetical protein